jgi:hypothetical protein
MYLLSADLDFIGADDDGGSSPWNSQLSFDCSPGEVRHGGCLVPHSRGLSRPASSTDTIRCICMFIYIYALSTHALTHLNSFMKLYSHHRS